MKTPPKKNLKNKEHVNRKIDKIINRLIASPNKQHQNNEQQLISITPAHQSTPSDPKQPATGPTNQKDPKDNTTNKNQLVE